ncbi:hypothetical protein SAMN05216302_101481 [Nitrosomonas aestuarii]|uniref:Transcriptional regulator, AlpA family n=1 Tax=Nitrosomonas aestuarii TaxID=52441 RepID=A0A1I4C4V6_9PROT|nr:hypothetical protein [Nitrosomonas aestuarii]SFK75660.1 hypothetical protein SAMN05216302_101481 [Nitrosomonas aestuarii]
MNTENPNIIDQLAKAIALHNTKPHVPIEKEVWNAKECAGYIGKSYQTFMSYYAPLPSFPKRIKLPSTSGGQSSPMWKAIEVINWVFSHQEKR